MKNYAFIKLIYSYLVVFFTCITIFLNLIWITKTYIEIRYDLYSVPYGLEIKSYCENHKNKNLSHDQIEKNRQNEIEIDKKDSLQRMKKEVFSSNLPTLFYAIIIMLIHVFLIIRTRKKLS